MAMNSQNKTTVNAANAAVAEKEAVMNNNTATETVNAPATQEQAQVPATAPEVQQPTEKVGFWEGPVGSKIKKVGKWVAAGAAIAGGLFVANKLGNATGYAQGRADADAAYANNNGSSDPVPDDIPEDAIIDDGDGNYSEIE